MKKLLLILVSISSLSVFAADVGEQKKPEDCAATAATNKREPKAQPAVVSQEQAKDKGNAVIKK